MMHFAVPSEFESILQIDDDEVWEAIPQHEVKGRWAETFESLDNQTISMSLLSSLKMFFKDKGLDFGPMQKSVFQAAA